MSSSSWVRPLSRGAAVAVLLVSVAACGFPWLGFQTPSVTPTATATPTPSPSPTPTPSPTPSPSPMSTLDSFKARVTSSDFQAGGSVSGTITVTLFGGSSSGPVTGTFKVKGGDSAESISPKILGATITYDSIVVGGWSYTRTNGGGWTKSPASGKTLQGFVGSVVLTDAGVETKFGRQLHHLTVANVSGVDPSAFGINVGSGQENLTLTSLSFWAEADGTPAGLSIGASLDQKVIGTLAHQTVTLDISIGTLSGVTITAPTN